MAKKYRPEEANSPASTSEAYDIMAPRWAKMRCVMGGTETMRAAGEAYLPRFDNETNRTYAARLSGAHFFNQTEMTVSTWVGKVFRDEPEVSDEAEALSDEHGGLFEDIDLAGNALVPFCRDWFRSAATFGLAYNLVLLPPAEPTDAPRTRADDITDGRRPYWTALAPENVLYARYATRANGERYVSHLRVLGSRLETTGFVDTEVPEITVYDESQIQKWQLAKDPQTGKQVWSPVPGSLVDNPLGEVPLVVFYAEYEADFVGRSPLFALADVNIRHWQSTACQNFNLDVSRCPVLAASGVYAEDQIEVGPKKFLKSEDPSGRFYYVETNGAALAAGRDDLVALQKQMDTYGSDFLKAQKTHITAAASVLGETSSISPIEDMAVRFADALDRALYFTTRWLGVDPLAPGAVTFRVSMPDDDKNPDSEESSGEDNGEGDPADNKE